MTHVRCLLTVVVCSSSVVSGLVLALVAESVHRGKSRRTGAEKVMRAEAESLSKDDP